MKRVLIRIALGFMVMLVALAIFAYIMLSPKPSTRPANPLVTGVNYIGLTVNDIEATTALYSAAGGMEVAADTLHNAHFLQGMGQNSALNLSIHNTRLLQSANAQLLLMETKTDSAQPPTPVNGPGIAHICFQVNQTTQAYHIFLENGSTVIGAQEMQQINPNNPVYYAYLHDPDGVLIEVEHVDVAALTLDEPPKHQHRIRQISLATSNMQRLIDFYSVLLEEQNPRRIGRMMPLSGDKVDAVSGLTGSEIEMAWFQTRNLELEIVQYHSHPTSEDVPVKPADALGYNVIMFEVSDINRVAEVLATLNATITLAPTEIEDGQVMYARDPDNNLLGFQQLSAQSPFSAQRFKDNGI